MKILLLNPHIDTSHQVYLALQARGAALLVPGNATEAWQMLLLHGTSVDLAIIHREGPGGAGDPGIQFGARVKADSSQADLPLIFTTEKWGDAQCAAHQKTPQGANAYIRWPLDPERLLRIVDSVVGPVSRPDDGVVLEDASVVFASPNSPPREDSQVSIRLEAPDLHEPKLSGDFPPIVLEDPRGGPVLEQPSLVAPMAPEAAAPPEPASPETAPPAYTPAVPETDPKADPKAEPEDAVGAELPYLFGSPPPPPSNRDLGLSRVMGDALVPGGAAQTPDLETLKKYLLLREQDVAALSSQLKSARERVLAVEEELRSERSANIELTHVAEEQKRRIAAFEQEKNQVMETLQAELAEAKFQLKARNDRARALDNQVRETGDEVARIKDRVRADIRKIRVREKELENRLEIMKKDSEALISARESKIIELKRKLDLVEFNMDLLQDQYGRERENTAKLRERLAKAAQVVRLAGGILDGGASSGSEEPGKEPGDKNDEDTGAARAAS